jgi:hypothetical protein
MPPQFEAEWRVADEDEVWALKVGWFEYPSVNITTEMQPCDDGVWMVMNAVNDGQPIGSAARLIPWPSDAAGLL